MLISTTSEKNYANNDEYHLARLVANASKLGLPSTAFHGYCGVVMVLFHLETVIIEFLFLQHDNDTSQLMGVHR